VLLLVLTLLLQVRWQQWATAASLLPALMPWLPGWQPATRPLLLLLQPPALLLVLLPWLPLLTTAAAVVVRSMQQLKRVTLLVRNLLLPRVTPQHQQ
jgi:hypothetical protein